ncbi:uncharacterized protein AMSG_01949 [Thecamonas trahens ATCC 50062]|uniref:Phospholipid-transporting ATPase n=1 Tax=Thecamonas trahens ATCC 50062 TaxID=461836 RepID=A0A0L0DTV2_THETB|nr:hypothetical protein AMSG_01949 [Thecamonas trahens ATCC 50062]KNC55680.1 hypothetical protein AMSG_01949 [Thecamonas trahens ATCC 50062]|eukprot:XP_013761447.1 hypothetical protein AMSG_01949 [Thecamonas trahens ATCC 50062]
MGNSWGRGGGEHIRVIDVNAAEANATRGFRHNRIQTYKYTALTFLPLNLYEQFGRIANVYFLLIAILQQIPGVSPLGSGTTALTLAVVLGFTAVKEALEDWHRHRNDDGVNNRHTTVLRNGIELEVTWREVVVGDIVRCIDKEFFPADLLLLASSGPQGMCYIETSNLDGETNLKIRQALPATAELYGEISHLRGALRCDPPNAAMYSFSGELALNSVASGTLRVSNKQILLRESQLRNTRWVYGLVVYTGQDTKIMKSSNKVRLKKSNVERVTNTLIVLVFLFELLLCIICAVGNGIWLTTSKDDATYLMLGSVSPASEGALSFLTFLILFSNLIPISLYVSMETVKFGQSKLIDQDVSMYYGEKDIPCISRTSNLNEELGQVEYIFSDKTGTLTCNLMEFKKLTIGGRAYGEGTATYAAPADTLPPLPDPHPAAHPLPGLTDLASAPFVASTPVPHVCFVDEDERLVHAAASPELGRITEEFFTLLGVCHTVIPEAAPDAPGGLVYQAASPDEGALVNAAAAFGWRFIARTPSTVTVRIYDATERVYDVLHVNAFNSTRKRMSVVVRTPDDRIMLYCKGADTMIYDLLAEGDAINSATANVTQAHLDAYAKDGLRTLVCAVRELDPTEYEPWQARVDAALELEDKARKSELADLAAEIEQNLTLVGATAIEDKLQDQVPDTIASLREAGIKVWVLTGDKQETAIMIGKSCKLLDEDMRLFVVNAGSEDDDTLLSHADLLALLERYLDELGSALTTRSSSGAASREYACVVHNLTSTLSAKLLELTTACKSVIGCRVSPAQKAQVVKFVQDALDPVTLSIGDGANDVDMIKEAHIGVGINGEEGGQAALSADYAIGQFKYLKPLLLVHGHWCYHRIAKLIFYSFYKNIALALTFVEKWTFSLYNVSYTALPILIVGLYDQCLPRAVLLAQPRLYRTGPANRFFSIRGFCGWLLASLYHSLIFYYLGEAAVGQGAVDSSGQTAGLYYNGLVIMSCIVVTVTVKLCFETNTFSWLNWLALALNGGGYFLYILLFSFMGPVFSDLWSMYYVAPYMFAAPRFWFTLILIPVIALIPDVTFKFVRRWFAPEPYVIVQEQFKLGLLAGSDSDSPEGDYRAAATPLLPVSGRTAASTPWPASRFNKDRESSYAYDGAPEEHVRYIMEGLEAAHASPPKHTAAPLSANPNVLARKSPRPSEVWEAAAGVQAVDIPQDHGHNDPRSKEWAEEPDR